MYRLTTAHTVTDSQTIVSCDTRFVADMVWPISTLLMADMVFCVADMVVADVVCGRYRRFPSTSFDVSAGCRVEITEGAGEDDGLPGCDAAPPPPDIVIMGRWARTTAETQSRFTVWLTDVVLWPNKPNFARAMPWPRLYSGNNSASWSRGIDSLETN